MHKYVETDMDVDMDMVIDMDTDMDTGMYTDVNIDMDVGVDMDIGILRKFLLWRNCVWATSQLQYKKPRNYDALQFPVIAENQKYFFFNSTFAQVKNHLRGHRKA